MNNIELELINVLKEILNDNNAEAIIPYLDKRVKYRSENTNTVITGRDGYNGVTMYLRKRLTQINLSIRAGNHKVEAMTFISKSPDKKPYLLLSQIKDNESTKMKVTIKVKGDLITEINMRFRKNF